MAVENYPALSDKKPPLAKYEMFLNWSWIVKRSKTLDKIKAFKDMSFFC